MEPLPPRTSFLAEQRWPPMLLGVIGVTLIFTVFPNPLRPPPQNPNAQAEYAAGPPDTPNFNESGLASSGGVGSGGIEQLAPAALPSQAAPPPPQFRPRSKACIGEPPRQTEDPLSPPCVAWFDGSNGGATHRGVTRDEIVVLFYNDWGVEGDLSGPYDPRDEPSGSLRVTPEQGLVKTIKAQLRYFHERFQTYGRRVRLIGYDSQGTGTTCPQREGDASAGAGLHDPFAALDFSFENATCYLNEIGEVQGVMTFGINADLPPEVYERNAPLVFGFYPDQGLEAAWSADFACSLEGRRATFAGDTRLRSKQRTFGLMGNGGSQRSGEKTIGERLREELAKRCGLAYVELGSGGISQAAEQGITTIICQCGTGMASNAQENADAEEYHPEWFFPYGSQMLSNNANRAAASPTQNSFGMTHHWLMPRVQEQYHYRAYQTQEPGSRPNTSLNFRIYMQFLNLFTGIQAAGPNLTPESVRKGMFTFRYLNQADPSQPTGGYGPYGPKAVSDFTFIDTVALWWWHPDGTEPGGNRGCLALADHGRRSYLGEWPDQPTLFDPASSDCTADPFTGGGGGFFGGG